MLACVVFMLISHVDARLFSKHNHGMFQNTGAHMSSGSYLCVSLVVRLICEDQR